MLGLAYSFKKYFSFLPDGTTCHAWSCWNDERCWPGKPTWVSWTDALYGSAASYGKLYVALFNLINVCITCCNVLFNWVCNWDGMLCDKRKLASSSLCHEKRPIFHTVWTRTFSSQWIPYENNMETDYWNENPQYDSFQLKIGFLCLLSQFIPCQPLSCHLKLVPDCIAHTMQCTLAWI